MVKWLCHMIYRDITLYFLKLSKVTYFEGKNEVLFGSYQDFVFKEFYLLERYMK